MPRRAKISVLFVLIGTALMAAPVPLHTEKRNKTFQPANPVRAAVTRPGLARDFSPSRHYAGGKMQTITPVRQTPGPIEIKRAVFRRPADAAVRAKAAQPAGGSR